MQIIEKPTTAIVNWQEELAKEANIAASLETTLVTGRFFSLRGGQLSWQDNAMPNNEVYAIIVNYCFENVYYEGQFSPDAANGPACFAVGHKEEELAPHETVPNKPCDNCKACPNNEWGSSPNGRGKACRNTRRLALIPAGQVKNGSFTPGNAEFLATADLGYLRPPVTSVKAWALYVKQIATLFKRPPFGVITKIKVVPDPKTQFRLVFEMVGPVADEAMPIVMQRRAELEETMLFGYSFEEKESAKPVRKNRRY